MLTNLVDEFRHPDPRALLAPAALDAARRLAGMLSADESPDLSVLALLGKFHWLRWSTGPDDANDPESDGLDEAVSAYLPVFLAGRDVPVRLRQLIALSVLDDAAEDMFGRVLLSGDAGLLNDALALWRRISDSLSADHPLQGTCRGIIGMCLRAEFTLAGRRAALDESITYLQEAMETAPADEQLRPAFQATLSEALRGRFLFNGDPADLARAIEESLGSIESCAGAPDADALHGTLGMALLDRFELAGNTADLEASIASLSRASRSDIVAGPFRGSFLSQLGRALRLKSEMNGDVALLNRAVSLCTEAVSLIPAGHPDQAAAAAELGVAIIGQADRGGGHASLDVAVDLLTRVLGETDSGHPAHGLLLGGLAAARAARAATTGNRADLDAAIDGAERAVAAVPAGHPARAVWLSILGQSLLTRSMFMVSGADLDAAVTAYREALSAAGPDGHERSFYRWGCSMALLAKFARGGSPGCLDESIGMARQSREEIPEGHPDRSSGALLPRRRVAGTMPAHRGLQRVQRGGHADAAGGGVRPGKQLAPRRDAAAAGSTLDPRYRITVTRATATTR